MITFFFIVAVLVLIGNMQNRARQARKLPPNVVCALHDWSVHPVTGKMECCTCGKVAGDDRIQD